MKKNKALSFSKLKFVVIAIASFVASGIITWNTINKVYNIQEPTNTTRNSSQAIETPADTKAYLHVKELGIKLELSDSIKDIDYKLCKAE